MENPPNATDHEPACDTCGGPVGVDKRGGWIHAAGPMSYGADHDASVNGWCSAEDSGCAMPVAP